MGILIDIILIIIILISTFLGYKKGLVKLGAKLFAGIIAIIVTTVSANFIDVNDIFLFSFSVKVSTLSSGFITVILFVYIHTNLSFS